MKIAFVTNNYKPYSGGVVSSIDSFTKHMADLGHQVFIVTLDFEGLGNEKVGNVSIIRIFSPIRFSYKSNYVAIPWLPSRAILQTLLEINPDVVHSHHPFLLGVSALKVARRIKVPVLFTYHSQYEKFAHVVPLPQKITTNLIRKFTSDYCAEVDAIVAPSNSIKDEIEGRGCRTPVKVIPSGILPIYLQKKFSYKRQGDYFDLLYVGRFAKEKNIPFLLKMFAKLDSSFRITLVGYGPEKNNLKSMAYDVLGLSPNRVRFVIRPPKHQIAKVYQQSDLFVFSSLAETQGLVLAEAMAAGTPVVALCGPGQNDLVQNGKNGFLVKDQDEMVAKIVFIADNIELHKRLQKGAFEDGNSYDSKLLSQRMIEFYQDIERKCYD